MLIAAGSTDITPQYSVPLAGLEDRRERFERIADPLEINAILLRGGDESVLLLSMDVLYVGGRFEAVVKRELARAGLRECLLLAAASHTHYAPNLDTGKPELGVCDDQYCAHVEEKAVALVEMLVAATPVPARLRYASGEAQHSVNRRRPSRRFPGRTARGTVEMRANPGGPNDQAIHLMRLDDEAGRPRALVWSYACHPVAFPRPLDVTADFAGVVRRALRDDFHPDLPVLFLQGFSGDLRPPAIINPGRHPGRRIANALQGPALGRFSEAEYAQWSRSLAEIVSRLASSDSLRELASALRHRTAKVPLSRLIDGPVGERELWAIRLELADDLQLLTLSAEVVVEYGAHLKRIFPEARTIPVGCVGEVYGYLPTSQMLAEGGYEAGEFFEPFSLSGRFRPSLEDSVLAVMRELSEDRPAVADPVHREPELEDRERDEERDHSVPPQA